MHPSDDFVRRLSSAGQLPIRGSHRDNADVPCTSEESPSGVFEETRLWDSVRHGQHISISEITFFMK
jgi:hypothetical protein